MVKQDIISWVDADTLPLPEFTWLLNKTIEMNKQKGSAVEELSAVARRFELLNKFGENKEVKYGKEKTQKEKIEEKRRKASEKWIKRK